MRDGTGLGAILGATLSVMMALPVAASDLLLIGGTVHTGKGTAEAILIRDARIAFVGPAAQARLAASNARIVDLHHAAAFPGFVDAHGHLTGIGMRELTLALEGTASIKDLQSRLAAYAKAHPEGPIIGSGWIETHWPEKRFPNRADLDAVIADRPVWLKRADGHAGIANSAALALAGIDRNTADPDGGRIEHDAAGLPSGMVIDHALGLIDTRLPPPTPAMRRAALQRAMALYAARGWTGIHNMSVTADDIAVLTELAGQGKVPIRIDNFMTPEDSERVLSDGPWSDPSGMVRIRGVKLYADGALGSRGAALLQPYSDAPGNGLVLTSSEHYATIFAAALKAHAQIAVHAIGDRGNRLVLDAFQKAFGSAGGAALRWRIEHAQILDAADLPRFAEMGVIASMQPSHAVDDFYFAPARLGAARLTGAYAWKSLLATGAVVAGGTDAPVEKGDPRIEFYAAVYRHDLGGFAGPDWHLEQAVSRDQALRMFTAAPAYAVFRDNDLGTLEVGHIADISVFSADLMTVPPKEIPGARTVLTIVGGRIVYQEKR